MSVISIECIDLSKDYSSRRVLSGITFHVEAGSVCALTGANGAGKTTLLKILSTLVTVSSGHARVCGADVALAPEKVRRCIGYITSEERSFYWRLTGRQNLRFFAALYGMDTVRREERIDMLLSRIGLDGMGDRIFREYSTGMKQALSIARGLLHDPQVVLADEPTRSLSVEASERFYDLVRAEAQKGKTILFASHDSAEVQHLTDVVVSLENGRVVRAPCAAGGAR